MELVKIEMEIEKNYKEISDFAIGLLDSALRGASLDEYMAKLPQLMSAADGYKEAFASLSSSVRNENLAYSLKQIADVVAPDDKPPEAPAEEPAPAA
jgi:hypothetical protein